MVANSEIITTLSQLSEIIKRRKLFGDDAEAIVDYEKMLHKYFEPLSESFSFNNNIEVNGADDMFNYIYRVYETTFHERVLVIHKPFYEILRDAGFFRNYMAFSLMLKYAGEDAIKYFDNDFIVIQLQGITYDSEMGLLQRIVSVVDKAGFEIYQNYGEGVRKTFNNDEQTRLQLRELVETPYSSFIHYIMTPLYNAILNESSLEGLTLNDITMSFDLSHI